MSPNPSHDGLLEASFGKADPDHFRWQTEDPIVSKEERELVRSAFLPLGNRVLDLGCAEGATLVHLGRTKDAVGLDIFESKLAFARSRLPNVEFVLGSADALPFADASFDHILIRDVIHHIQDPSKVVAECARVLSPGGRLDILEPNGKNPMIAAHALLNPVERLELRSSVGYLTNLLGPAFKVTKFERFQPMPLHRLVFHPRAQRLKVGGLHRVSTGVKFAESLFGRALPKALWAYIHVRAVKG